MFMTHDAISSFHKQKMTKKSRLNLEKVCKYSLVVLSRANT